MSIIFHSLVQGYSISNKRKIIKWLNEIIQSFQKVSGYINIIFINDKMILELNKKYLKRDYYTDILTFNLNEKNKISGDLYISYERVEQNAKRFNVTFNDEMLRVIVHGILHLLGFDDKTKIQKSRMKLMEDKALALFYGDEIK